MQFGIDTIASGSKIAELLASHRVGVIAHPASVDRELVHISEKLARVAVRPVMWFGPEHGFGGEAQDMVGVGDAKDRDGVPIRSLYGDAFDDLIPKDSDLRAIDLLLIDLADVGARYYTFVWTALLALRAAKKLGVRVVVLDRPNPIGADSALAIEGKILDPKFRSFVGLEPIAIRHALSVGEIIALFAEEEKTDERALTIIPFAGVARDAHAPSWDRPFVMTSPNMPTYETALVYPGGCLLEGTNLSEGRGTTRPFELVGAPWLDGARLAKAISALEFPGFRARPITFLPQFQKHAKQICGGVQIHVEDARTFRPVATYAALIAFAHAHHPDEFRFRTERYEFIDTIPALDLLCGSAETRERMIARDAPRAIAEDLARTGATEQRMHERARAAYSRFARADASL